MPHVQEHVVSHADAMAALEARLEDTVRVQQFIESMSTVGLGLEQTAHRTTLLDAVIGRAGQLPDSGAEDAFVRYEVRALLLQNLSDHPGADRWGIDAVAILSRDDQRRIAEAVETEVDVLVAGPLGQQIREAVGNANTRDTIEQIEMRPGGYPPLYQVGEDVLARVSENFPKQAAE